MRVVEPATDNSPAKYETSGPLKWAYKRNPDGTMAKTVVPFDKNDTHTHTVQYLDSQKFVPRKTNLEAVKLITAEEQKIAPVPGIVG